MSWKEESMKRILKVSKLHPDCMKYVRPDKEPLANQILTALLKSSSRNNEPVKLAEIAEVIYGPNEKDKQDVLRLTMDKTLIKCGIVDKIYFGERDVRYFPIAYRFQEVRRVETGAGTKIEEPVGEVVELPREHWPVPKEYFDLMASRTSYEEALVKLEGDAKSGSIDSQTHQRLKTKIERELEGVTRKLKDYEGMNDIMR
jgi:hypothetical protein